MSASLRHIPISTRGRESGVTTLCTQLAVAVCVLLLAVGPMGLAGHASIPKSSEGPAPKAQANRKADRKADRKPHRLAQRPVGKEPSSQLPQKPAPQKPAPQTATHKAFDVYSDADSPKNHFKPTGHMGDIGDIHINEAFGKNPHSGKTCICIAYKAKGKAPHECPYFPPCKWAGSYWLQPPNNWGKEKFREGLGFNLSRYNRLSFWARADKACSIEFKVGGINEKYGDSLKFPARIMANLTGAWQKFEIDLSRADLSHIIGGFCWVTNWDTNPSGATFYLDDIRFEK